MMSGHVWPVCIPIGCSSARGSSPTPPSFGLPTLRRCASSSSQVGELRVLEVPSEAIFGVDPTARPRRSRAVEHLRSWWNPTSTALLTIACLHHRCARTRLQPQGALLRADPR